MNRAFTVFVMALAFGGVSACSGGGSPTGPSSPNPSSPGGGGTGGNGGGGGVSGPTASIAALQVYYGQPSCPSCGPSGVVSEDPVGTFVVPAGDVTFVGVINNPMVKGRSITYRLYFESDPSKDRVEYTVAEDVLGSTFQFRLGTGVKMRSEPYVVRFEITESQTNAADTLAKRIVPR